MSAYRRHTWIRAAVLLLLVSCADTTPYKIGFVATLSGRQSGLGIEGRNGAIMAVEEINAAGGVDGRSIELIFADDENDPETAREVVTGLLDEEVEAIIGHMTSSMALSTINLINQARIPIISPTVSTLRLSGVDDFFFRINAPLDQDARIIAAYAREILGLGRVSVIYDLSNLGYSDDWAGALSDYFIAAGGDVSGSHTFTSGSNDELPGLAERIRDDESDGVVIIAGAVDTALIAQQIRKYDRDIPLMSSTWAKTNDVITHGGSAAEGMVFSEIFSPDSLDADYLVFRNRFIERFGYEPNFPGAEAYEAVFFLAEGLQRHHTGDYDGLVNALGSIRSLEGTQGTIGFDEFGDASRPHRILEIRDGRFVYIDGN